MREGDLSLCLLDRSDVLSANSWIELGVWCVEGMVTASGGCGVGGGSASSDLGRDMQQEILIAIKAIPATNHPLVIGTSCAPFAAFVSQSAAGSEFAHPASNLA